MSVTEQGPTDHSQLEPRGPFVFEVPCNIGDTTWVDLIHEVAPETRIGDPVYHVGDAISRPRPALRGHIKTVLVPFTLHLECGRDSPAYARQHGLFLANPYHVLATIRHVPDIRARLNHKQKRGPGLFGTDPIVDSDWSESALGLWQADASARQRAQLMTYNEILGSLTYFVFATEQWLTN